MISLLRTSLLYASVAQVVEQETENLRVGSASLSQATKITIKILGGNYERKTNYGSARGLGP